MKNRKSCGSIAKKVWKHEEDNELIGTAKRLGGQSDRGTTSQHTAAHTDESLRARRRHARRLRLRPRRRRWSPSVRSDRNPLHCCVRGRAALTLLCTARRWRPSSRPTVTKPASTRPKPASSATMAWTTTVTVRVCLGHQATSQQQRRRPESAVFALRTGIFDCDDPDCATHPICDEREVRGHHVGDGRDGIDGRDGRDGRDDHHGIA